MSSATPEPPRSEFGPDQLAAFLGGALPGYPVGRLAVALSGGPDSAALLAVAAGLCRRQPDLELRALHVNHGLQAAAADLESSARAQAAALAVPLTVLAVTIPEHAAGGVEAAAREHRYRALGACLRTAEALLTAHHEDDQAETLLLQLLRGAGLKGLSGMPAAAALGPGWHLRPCLGVPRDVLTRQVAAAGLTAVDDPMNADPRYDRAYLRRALAPALSARWPAWRQTLARTAGHLARAQTLIDGLTSADLATAVRGSPSAPSLDVAALAALGAERRALVVREWLRRAGHRPPSTARLAAVGQLLEAAPGRSPVLCLGGQLLYRHGGALCAGAPLPPFTATVPVSGSGSAALPGLGRVVVTAAAAGSPGAESLVLPAGRLELRPRAGGERLTLARGAPRRAVKDLLREAGIPAHLRRSLPFVWSGEVFVGVLTPGGVLADAACRAASGEAGIVLRWVDAPPALAAAFVETIRALP